MKVIYSLKQKKKKKYNFIFIVVLLALVLGSVFVFRIISFSREKDKGVVEEVGQDAPKYESLSGRYVSLEDSLLRPLAIVVENHPDARPQSGLSSADMVYEALAEGGITRYLAVFQGRGDVSIGPVRSARDYFAAMADMWGAGFAHVGGSPEALEQLSQGKYNNVLDLNEYYKGDLFERSKARFAPHNVYTTTEKIYEYLKDQDEANIIKLPKFTFVSDDDNTSFERAYSISMDFSTDSFGVSYTFDPETKTYKRKLAGKADVDAASKQQLSPKTVIVQVVDVTDVPNDPALRVDIDLKSGGKVLVFSRGGLTQGTWSFDQDAGFQYKDGTGEAISFPRGQVWVELLPADKFSSLKYEPKVTNP